MQVLLGLVEMQTPALARGLVPSWDVVEEVGY